MNRKLTLLILLACVACVGTLMFAFQAQNEELRLKKTHSFQASKNHEWGWGVDGYTSSDSECQAKCDAVKGKSCGKYIQNCCQQDKCAEETSGYGPFKSTSYNCNARIPVDGCTKPKQ